jgi:hypothetical protein
MGNQASTVQEGSPLACLLKHWKDLDPEILQQKQLKVYCTQAWPQYPLGDEERWPGGGSINYNTILQLDMLCKKQGKWTKVPYVPKRPPRMSEQMQARYSDHGNPLQKAPELL